MIKWRCQYKNPLTAETCKVVAEGCGQPVGLLAIGWYYLDPLNLFCPLHRPDPIPGVYAGCSLRSCGHCKGQMEADRFQKRLGANRAHCGKKESMATQGMLTVLREGQVLLKVVAGCGGYHMDKLRDRLLTSGVDSLQRVWEAALEEDVGCADCLVVVSADDSYYQGEEELPDLYRKTLANAGFNPRCDDGRTGRWLVAELDSTEGFVLAGC